MSHVRTDADGDLDVACLTLSALSPEDRAGWRQLASHGSVSAPFVDEGWIVSWIEAFGPREPLLVGGWEQGRLVGLGALQSLSESWAGRRVRVIQSLTNLQSSRFEFVSPGGRVDIQERLWWTLCEAGRWDVIRLEHLPEDSPTLLAGIKVADQLRWNRVLEQTFESPWRPLPRPPTPWDDGLKTKFTANLRRRARRLQALGEVRFEVVKGGVEQRAALETFYALEASGWKGECGTAIVQEASTKAFYDRLVERTGPCVWIPILSVAGRAAAAQLVRVHGRTLFLLKTAYDPGFSRYSPGQLLTARLMGYGIESGMEALDFLAADMPWKDDWSPRLRQHYRLLLFSPCARGRYAYWTRYGIREHAKRIPGAQRLVRWIRTPWRRQ